MNEKNQQDTIQFKIKESLSMSTLKGIPRVMKTKNKFIKSLWIVGSMLVIVAAGFHWYYLFNGYLKRSVFTIVQENYEAILSNENFPGVTLCSLAPFSNNHDGNISSYREFHAMLSEKLKEYQKNKQPLSERIKRLLRHRSVYFDWLGLENAGKIGQKKRVFILNCKLKISGYEGAYLPCKNYSTIRLIQNPHLFNCYSIKFNLPQVENGVIDKAVFTLYLGDTSSDYEFYLRRNNNLLGEGIKVLVHDKNDDYPKVQSEGFIISKGSKAIVTTRPIFRIRKPHPYTNCEEKPKPMYNFTGHPINSTSFSYCSLKTWQNEVVKRYKCVSTTLLVVSSLEHLKLPRCMELSSNITLNGLETVINFTKGYYGLSGTLENANHTSGSTRCRHPCYEHHFTQSYSSIHLKGSYLINLMEYSDYADDMEKYLQNLDNYKICIRNNSEKFCLDKAAITPYENLVELEIQQNIHFGALIEYDAPVFELPDFLAKLAATINFWVGFSAIVFIEIIDLILQILLPKN